MGWEGEVEEEEEEGSTLRPPAPPPSSPPRPRSCWETRGLSAANAASGELGENALLPPLRGGRSGDLGHAAADDALSAVALEPPGATSSISGNKNVPG